jgi:predicted AAA+ superfamily ATPase
LLPFFGLRRQRSNEATRAFCTAGGAEVDLVLEGEFGLLPVEIKYQQAVSMRQVNGIRDLIAERGCRLGIVVNNDERPRQYDDKLVGVPFVCL